MSASLPESLRRETRDLHVAAERSAFMGELLRGRMQRPAYVALLRNLHAIYAELEPALRRHAAHPALSPLMLEGLFREAPLRRDLDALHGADWAQGLPLQPAAIAYAARLRDIDARTPELLIAHSYVRYLGDLSGGQMLAGIVRESLRLGAAGTPGVASDGGTDFYDFGDATQTAALKRTYRDALAMLPVDELTARAIVDEARQAFELHRALFEQLARAELAPGAAATS